MKTIVKAQQNWIDLAIVLTGNADKAYEIAKENRMTIFQLPPVGMEVQYSGEIVDKDVCEFFRIKGIQPATGVAE